MQLCQDDLLSKKQSNIVVFVRGIKNIFKVRYIILLNVESCEFFLFFTDVSGGRN